MKSIYQHQYITNCHDSFVDYIGNILGVVVGLMARPGASEKEHLSALQIPVVEG